MSLKAKLVSSVAAFCLVLALLVVGVLAVNQATVQLGGSISFTANDVIATVTVTSTGATTDLNETIKFDSTDANDDEGTLTDLGLVFANKTSPIVITVTITNDSEDSMTVTPTAPTVSGSDVTISTQEKNGTGSVTDITTSAKTVTAGSSIVYTITISMASGAANNDISATWSATYQLERA